MITRRQFVGAVLGGAIAGVAVGGCGNAAIADVGTAAAEWG